ncbi:MAG: CBS domain-containing protein [Nitrospirota bacterium]
MNTILTNKQDRSESIYFLSDIVGTKVFLHDQKIGKLQDVIIREHEKLPEVTHFIVGRPFGRKPLLVPWDKVAEINRHEVIISGEDAAIYEGEPAPSQVLLRDHILDKKVIDMDDNEIDVVYDIKLVVRNGKMYVTDVDFSGYALLKRLGLKPIAKVLFDHGVLKKDTLSWAYVQHLPEDIGRFRGAVKLKVLKDKLSDIDPVDLADILEELDNEQRLAIFQELDTEHASDTLEEIEPRVQRTLISSMDKGRVADLIDEMTPAQAADVLSVLPAQEKDEILKLMEHEEAEKIESLLDKQDDTIANMTTAGFIKLGPEETVDDAIKAYRLMAPDADVTTYIYVVDPEDRLLGVVNLQELLIAKLQQRLEEVMSTQVISLGLNDTIDEAEDKFLRYGFRALPVAGEDDVIVGVVPYRDIMNLKH